MNTLLAFITADIKDEVNAWIDANIEDAGPETFSIPYSSDGTGEATHYVTCWRIDGDTRTYLVSHLSTYGSKFSHEVINAADIRAKVNELPIKAIIG